MKKTRFFAFLALTLAALLVLSACGAKLSKRTVEADPLSYVRDGAKLTFKNTPFSSVTEKKEGRDRLSGELSLSAEGESLILKFGSDITAGRLFADVDFKTADESALTSEIPAVKAAIYVDGGKIVAKSDYLKEIFGADTVGIDLADLKDIKNTETFKSFLTAIGMTEDEFTETLGAMLPFDIFDKTKAEEIETKVKEIIEKLKADLADGDYIDFDDCEVTDVSEETIVLNGVNVKTVVVSYSVREDAFDEIYSKLGEYFNDMLGTLGMGSEDGESLLPDSERETDGFKMKTTQKAYLSAETGALVRFVAEEKTEGFGETDATLSVDLSFGADPTRLFMPSVEINEKIGGTECRVQATSAAVDNKLVTDGSVRVKADGNEKEVLSFNLEYGEGGAYVLTISNPSEDEKGSVKISGVFNNGDDGLELTANVEEDKQNDISAVAFSLKLRYGAEVPAAPEYKDILGLSTEELAPIMEILFGGQKETDPEFENYAFSVLAAYTGMTESELNSALTEGYAAMGFPDTTSYLYYNFVQYRAADMIQNYGVAEAAMQQLWDDVANAGGTYLDLARAFEDEYVRVVG